MKTFVNIFNELNNSETKKYKVKKKVIMESDGVKVEKVKVPKLEEYYRLPDDEHIIWDSEIDYYDEETMNDVKENQYQDYLDSFEPSVPTFDEWVEDQLDNLVSSGAYETREEALEDMRDDLQADYEDYIKTYKDEPLDFETWYEGYIEDSAYDDSEYLVEDLEDNVLPEIEKQLNDKVLLLSGGYNSNYADFRPSGAGGVMWNNGTSGFRDYIGNFDRVAITTSNGVLGAVCADHDGTVAGSFYTLPADKTELMKALGYESEEEFEDGLYYEGIDARDLNQHIDLLVPVKDTISSWGATNESEENSIDGIELNPDEAEQLNNILDTDYDLVWDELDDDKQTKYKEIASTIRRLKPEEAIIDVIDEINEKAKENKLEKDLLLYAYMKDKKLGECDKARVDSIKKGLVSEDTEEDLENRFDSRKSFYGKAKVVKKDNGDEELYSYGTHVGGIRDGKPYSKGRFSQTTSRHQREFFKQRGYDLKDVPIEESYSTHVISDKIYSVDSFVELLDLLDGMLQDKKVSKARNLVSHAYTHIEDDEEDERLDEIKDEVISILTENKIEEAEVKNIQPVKNQGNIYMLKDEEKYIVGENYNEAEHIIENAEIYETKEEADKDYLGRCEITGGSEEVVKESEDIYKSKPVEISLSDQDKIKYYYGTVRGVRPWEVYKVNGKFYDGNGCQVDEDEIKELIFFDRDDNIEESIEGKTIEIHNEPDMEVIINHFREMVKDKPSNIYAVKFLMKYDKDFDNWVKENNIKFPKIVKDLLVRFDKKGINEDVVRTDVSASKGYGPDVNVSLNTLRETLAAFDKFYEVADNLGYAEGVSEEFSEKLDEFFDEVVYKEYNKILTAIGDTEKKEVENSKKPQRKSKAKKD